MDKLLVVLLLVATSVFFISESNATGQQNHHNQNHNQNQHQQNELINVNLIDVNNRVGVHNNVDNNVHNVANGGAGGSADSSSFSLSGSKVENSGNSNATASNGGNMLQTHYNSSYKQVHNTPNMAAMFAYPTAPCALPVGGTGAGAGFGFGFNTAYVNQECVKSETAKLAMALSKPSTATEIFCTMEHAENTTECRELRMVLGRQNKLQPSSNATPIQTSSDIGGTGRSFDNGGEIKRGPFGTRWDDISKQWVF